MVVGGPITMVLAGGAAAYAATRKDQVGAVAQTVGRSTTVVGSNSVSTAKSVKKWVGKKSGLMSSSSKKGVETDAFNNNQGVVQGLDQSSAKVMTYNSQSTYPGSYGPQQSGAAADLNGDFGDFSMMGNANAASSTSASNRNGANWGAVSSAATMAGDMVSSAAAGLFSDSGKGGNSGASYPPAAGSSAGNGSQPPPPPPPSSSQQAPGTVNLLG